MNNAVLSFINLWELLANIFIVGIPIFLVIWFYKLIARNKNENIRLRLEVGKLADELEQIRKKVPEDEANELSEKS